MFQTELIHALQAFASEGMTGFMLAVSSLGYPYTLVPILVVITFGIDFRRGFLLIQVVLWNAAFTEFLKAAFALPRPDAVDSTLLQPGDDLPEVYPFERRGAPSFWAPLPADVVAYYRGLGEFSYGFPSGHCSVTTSLWGSAALLFRERWLWFLSLGLIVLMPLSRMYLARHFLAGVLGGTTVGLLVIGVAWYVAIGPVARGRSSRLARRFETEAGRFALYLAPPLLVTLVPGVELVSAVRLVGLGLGLWLLTRIGLPVEDGSLANRFFRVVLAVVLYGLVNQGVGGLLESWLGERDTLEALVEGASGFVMTVGTVVLSYRLGWYRRGEPGLGLLGG
jgi:membrane-associated phospholipid phosphatase